METIRVQDHEVFVYARPEGDRRPVVCVHSTGMSHLQWRRLARRLSKAGHPVYVPDLLGYGQTGLWRGPGAFTTAYDMEIVERVAESVGGPVHLVGHSYGGRLVMGVAAQRPDLVHTLAAYEPTCFGVLRSLEDGPALRELEEFDPDGRFLDDASGGSPEWVERFVNYWNGSDGWSQMGEAQQRAFISTGRKMFEEVRETSTETVPHTTYAHLECPALFLSGTESTVAGRACSRLLAQTLTAGKHLEIDAGHMGPLVAADEVNELLLAHIDTHDG